MKIIIDVTDISDIVTAADFSESAAAESSVVTLSGNTLVDRFGSFKATLTVQIGNVSFERWEVLTEKLKALPVPVKIVRNGVSKSYSMVISGSLPKPHTYSVGGKDYCVGAEITLVEVG